MQEIVLKDVLREIIRVLDCGDLQEGCRFWCMFSVLKTEMYSDTCSCKDRYWQAVKDAEVAEGVYSGPPPLLSAANWLHYVWLQVLRTIPYVC